jgi:hypothetical protein
LKSTGQIQCMYSMYSRWTVFKMIINYGLCNLQIV